jgi:NitT/TauT family transport system substrate-binding protein
MHTMTVLPRRSRLGVWLLTTLILGACSSPAAPAKPAAPTTAPAAPPTAAPQAAPAQPTAAAAAGPAQKAPAQSLGKVTIALPSLSLSFSPVVVADKMGFFKQQGLDVELVQAGSGSKAAAAVIGNSAEIGASDFGDMVGAVEKGQDVRIFAGFTVRPTNGLVVKKEVADRLGINSAMPIEQRVQALKGLKLAISTPGSGTDNTQRYILRNYGLDPERDVEILTTGSVVNALATFAKGAADGTTLSSPSTEQAVLRNGAVYVVKTSDGEIPAFKDQAQQGFWSTGKWLDANPEKATAATAAIWQALEYIRTNPVEAGKVVRDEAWAETEQDVFDEAWKTVMTAYADTPALTQARVESLIQWSSGIEGHPATVKWDALATNKFADQAKTKLGR